MTKDEIIGALTALSRQIEDYAASGAVRFHMPGHAGVAFDKLPDALIPAYKLDVTELDFSDNLYDPSEGGPIKSACRALAAIYGTGATVPTTGGATAALFAAIAAAASHDPERAAPLSCDVTRQGSNIASCGSKKRGVKFLCARGIHKSAVYAMAAASADADFIYPDESGEYSSSDFAAALKDGAYNAVIITSPDYYGHIQDVALIASVCHDAGVPLICDAAHGAHLDFYEGGRLSPVKNGADLTISSLHKTLPAMTGAALLHGTGCFGNFDMLCRRMARSASTSPSYPIILSIFSSVAFMYENGARLTGELARHVDYAKNELRALGFLLPGHKISDPCRITISPPDGDGRAYYNYLSQKGIMCEFTDGHNVVMIPSVLHGEREFEALMSASCDYVRGAGAGKDKEEHKHKNKNGGQQFSPCVHVKTRPKRAMSLSDALLCEFETVKIKDAIGRVCAEPAAPYPPGVPILMPGEVCGEEEAEMLMESGVESICVTL